MLFLAFFEVPLQHFFNVALYHVSKREAGPHTSPPLAIYIYFLNPDSHVQSQVTFQDTVLS